MVHKSDPARSLAPPSAFRVAKGSLARIATATETPSPEKSAQGVKRVVKEGAKGDPDVSGKPGAAYYGLNVPYYGRKTPWFSLRGSRSPAVP
jgi:hypothetical protein